MKYWKYSLYFGIFSFAVLVVIFISPANYTIFIFDKTGLGPGKLFGVIWLIWITALLAFALNNIFADKWYMDENLRMNQLQKYLPSLTGIPAFISFVWFLYTWLKDFRQF